MNTILVKFLSETDGKPSIKRGLAFVFMLLIVLMIVSFISFLHVILYSPATIKVQDFLQAMPTFKDVLYFCGLMIALLLGIATIAQIMSFFGKPPTDKPK